jgi:uncharacterized protein
VRLEDGQLERASSQELPRGPAADADSETPWVLFEPARSPHSAASFVSRYAQVLDACGLDRHSRVGEEVLVKIDVGEVGAFRTLRPIFVRMLVEKIQNLGRDAILFDTARLTAPREQMGWSWVDAATVNGFVSTVLGGEVVLGDGWGGGEVELLAVDGEELGGIEVARTVVDGGPLVVMSHVTGHPLSGMSAALQNLGEGCLGATGKRRLYRDLVPVVDQPEVGGRLYEGCDGCGDCLPACPAGAISLGEEGAVVSPSDCMGCSVLCTSSCPREVIVVSAESRRRLQRRLVESAGAVLVASMRRALFVNFLLDVTARPDAAGYSDLPVVPDLGVLVSRDPVALDAATLDLLDAAPGVAGSAAQRARVLAPGEAKFPSLTGADPRETLLLAEQYGLGSRQYRLATL